MGTGTTNTNSVAAVRSVLLSRTSNFGATRESNSMAAASWPSTKRGKRFIGGLEVPEELPLSDVIPKDNPLARLAVGANGHVCIKGEDHTIGIEPEGREMIITKENVPTKPKFVGPWD